jgi:predicted kinase
MRWTWSSLLVECTAPADVVAERASRRELDAARVSDATPAIAARQRREFEPLDEVPPDAHLSLRTDRPRGDLVGALEDWLDLRLAGQIWRT